MSALKQYIQSPLRLIINVVFYMTCVFSTIDTTLFVYPSLSRSMLMECCVLALTLIAITHAVAKRKNFVIDSLSIYLLCWITFVVVHGLLLPVMEEYRTLYLCITLFGVLPLAYLRSIGMLTRRSIENGLLLVTMMHILCILGQYMGFFSSYNAYFAVVGFNENPTVTAIYIVGTLPLIVGRLRDKRFKTFYFILLLLCLLSLVCLKCRTAYIGLCIENFIGTTFYVRNNKNSVPILYKWAFLLLSLVIVAVVAMKLYKLKQDSADSRLLIWKLSAKMIVEKPQGYGYGLYEKYYNLRQSDYFRGDVSSDIERRTASFTAMAYNDYLEHGVEGGIIGMFFIVTFYVMLIRKSLRKCDMQICCVVGSFSVMSLTNFVYSSIQPWLLLMCYASLLVTIPEKSKGANRYVSSVSVVLLLLSVISMIKVISMTRGQIVLKSYSERIPKRQGVSDSLMLQLRASVGTSEAYWNLCAYNNIKQGKYAEAMAELKKAHQLTSSPQVFEMLYFVCQHNEKEKEGIKYIDTLCSLQPSLLHPKLLLMEYYKRHGERDMALKYAKDILITPARVNNETSLKIKSKAQDFINSNH